MKNRKIIITVLYVVILALAFSWMLGLFGGRTDNVPYSQVITLFTQEQVKRFVVEGDIIEMQIGRACGHLKQLSHFHMQYPFYHRPQDYSSTNKRMKQTW